MGFFKVVDMRKMMRNALLAAVVFGGTLVIWAQDNRGAAFDGIIESVYAGTESEARVLELIDEGIRYAAGLGSPEGDAWKAELFLLRGRILLEKGNKNEADKDLARAEESAVLANGEETASTIALLVEIRTAMFATRGLGYILGNSGVIEKLLNRAFEMEPQNPRVLILKANSELYKPFGNLDASILFFNKAVERPGLSRPQRFMALYGLAEAWNKKWDGNRRREHLLKAQTLYPRNPALLKALREAGVK
jgi:hypothetical protein